MEIVKKNIISIICGVIAIAAVVASFLPLGGMMQTDLADLQKDQQTYNSMNALLHKSRQMPSVDPDKPEQETLPVAFPGPEIIKQGQGIVAEMKKQSEAMRDAAVAMNKHELLVPHSLPNPPMQAQQIQFRERYRDLFATTQPGQLPRIFAPMKAGVPPTAEAIMQRKQETQDKIVKENLVSVQGQPINQATVTQMVADAVTKLPDQMRSDAANNSLVYVMPDAFDAYQKIGGGVAPSPSDIFAAQLMLWMQQDIMAAIMQTNAGSKNVTEAPVKRLIKAQLLAPSTGGMFIVDPAVATAGDPDAALTKVPAHPTQRTSNPMYDVIHFTLNVDVEAAKLNKFLMELTRNRLITPFQVSVQSCDEGQRLLEGFVYGNQPVLNVQMECEMLFMRAWTQQYMPQTIRDYLKIPAEQPAQPGQAPAEQQPVTPAAAPAPAGH